MYFWIQVDAKVGKWKTSWGNGGFRKKHWEVGWPSLPHCTMYLFPASTGLGVCDPSRVCLMFADKGRVCERWGSSRQDPLWLWEQLRPWVLDLVEKCQPRSHVGCLPLFQVFYSEVGVDKSLQERSYGVPPGLDTPTSVSSSILAAPSKAHRVSDISLMFRRISNLVCVCASVCIIITTVCIILWNLECLSWP